MKIDFGSIKSYNPNRGFGFVTRTFGSSKKTVFFHIRKIKIKHPILAQKLDDGKNIETINFWYEVKKTEKGEEASKLWLNRDEIPQCYTYELSRLTQEVEFIWKNLDSQKPSWLDFVTTELVGVDRRHELSVERDNLERKIRRPSAKNKILIRRLDEFKEKELKEKELKEKELKEKEELSVEELARKYSLSIVEAEELHELLKEMRPLKFTHSHLLSQYIVKNKLGYKYQNISGIVKMEDKGTSWDFRGGFPPKMYSIICQELKLGNKRTNAKVVEFTSFKNLYYSD